MQAVPLTAVALLAFAANSLLARLALGGRMIDPWAYTGVRLAAGAAVLALLLRSRRGALPGSWTGAAALLAYALAFSLAYVRLPTGVGALVLFAAVQATMLGWGTLRGTPPSRRALAGMTLAAAGLVGLLAPGLDRPDPAAAALMALAGAAWGAYSLLGRGGSDPAGTTAGNFLRTLPAAALLATAGLGWGAWDMGGVALAATSGALASGLGYAVWYRVLPRLSVTQAGAVQLAVPAVAALAGVVLLHEPATLRLVLAGSLTLAGVALAVLPAR